MSPGKTEIMLNISDTIELTFIKFSPNGRTVAGHLILVTDYFENVCQGRNFQKCVILKDEFAFKKYTKSNLAVVIGNTKIGRGSEVFSITNDHRL